MLQDVISEAVLPLTTRFRIEGRSSSPTLKFWDGFLIEVLIPQLEKTGKCTHIEDMNNTEKVTATSQ